MGTPPRGRRPGQPDTRSAIVEVARERFLVAGYHEVSLRAVAEAAGVDVALVGYYFGSKRGLFVEALAGVSALADRVGRAVAGGELATLPRRLFIETVREWDADDTPMRAIATAAPLDADIRAIYVGAIESAVVEGLAGRVGGRHAQDRAAAYSAIVTGVLHSRYQLQIEPLASMPAADLVELMAPALTVALLGPSADQEGTVEDGTVQEGAVQEGAGHDA